MAIGEELATEPSGHMANNVLQALQKQAEQPMGDDQRTAAFAAACIQEAASNDVFYDQLANFATTRPRFNDSQYANLLLRVYLKQLLRDPTAESFLAGAVTPDDWRPVIRDYSHPSHPANAEITADLAQRKPTSNVTERYKTVTAISQLALRRLGTAPRVLDVGCSQDQGLKKLALLPTFRDSRPFQVEVRGRRNSGQVDTAATVAMNGLLQNGWAIGPSLGVDITDPYDPADKEWAQACSFYPTERLSSERVEEYDLLDTSFPEQLRFHQGDFSSPQAPDEIRALWGDPQAAFDIVFFSTILNQIASSRRRQQMIANARQLVANNGYIVEQDFLRLPEGAERPVYYRNWEPPYRYRTIVYDAADPSERPFEIFRYGNGRCGQLQIMPGLQRLPHAQDFGLVKA